MNGTHVLALYAHASSYHLYAITRDNDTNKIDTNTAQNRYRKEKQEANANVEKYLHLLRTEGRSSADTYTFE